MTASSAPSTSSLPIPSVPQTAQLHSYSYSSPLPSRCAPVEKGGAGEPCVLGVDEAGRGPVLGPLVYGIAYCPLAFHDLESGSGGLRDVGFADSKALTSERRDTLLSALQSYPNELGWAIRSLSPQDISAGMLRRRPHNLNAQSSDATISLIQGVLELGVNLVHIYVDTVGDPVSYARLLSSHFPKHIAWTVTSKADALFPIVGAASIAAKTTRDAALEGWVYAEALGAGNGSEANAHEGQWETGSGYPGDPRTVSYLQRNLEPVFGWPGIVRFSWATIKTLLEEKVPAKRPSASSASASASASKSATCTTPPPPGAKRGYAVKWNDEATPIARFFSAAPKSGGASAAAAGQNGLQSSPSPSPAAMQEARATAACEKGRSRLARDLGLVGVAAL